MYRKLERFRPVDPARTESVKKAVARKAAANFDPASAFKKPTPAMAEAAE